MCVARAQVTFEGKDCEPDAEHNCSVANILSPDATTRAAQYLRVEDLRHTFSEKVSDERKTHAA